MNSTTLNRHSGFLPDYISNEIPAGMFGTLKASNSRGFYFTGVTGDNNIDGLISGGIWYDPDSLTPWYTEVTYSFPQNSSDFQSHMSSDDVAARNSLVAFGNIQQNAMRKVFDGFEEVSQITFTKVDSNEPANIVIAGTTNSDVTPTASSEIPGGSDVNQWYNANYYDLTPEAGSYTWHTLIHETGHSLGLAHGHEVDRDSPVDEPIPGKAMNPNRDSMEFSVMTYRSYINDPLNDGYSNEDYGYAQSLMMYDIAAIQQMYGANYDTNNDDTTYTFSSTTGEMFINGVSEGAPGDSRIFRTIWDGNGNDTYDFSNYNNGITVDLAPGSWSLFSEGQKAYLGDGNYARANVFNALLYEGDTDSLIENAIGGDGNDSLSGNIGSNKLTGGNGNDTLTGEAGDDTLIAGNGNDTLLGGNDEDTLIGGNGDDILRGGDDNDFLRGGNGADTLDGGQGIDWVSYSEYKKADIDTVIDLRLGQGLEGVAFGDTYLSIENVNGSDGNDTIIGTDSINTLNGRKGNDTLKGYAGDDTLLGGNDEDTLIGGNGDDILRGGDDNDFLRGGNGADTLDGGQGIDWVSYTEYKKADTDTVIDLRLGQGLEGVAFGDTYLSIENVNGSDGNDTIIGTDGINTLNGRKGNDTLKGYAGNDTLLGGSGDDTLVGGVGNDILRGGDDNDFLRGGNGADTLDGGQGIDWVSYTEYKKADIDTVIDLRLGQGLEGVALGDTYLSIENVNGSDGNDTIIGTDGMNTLNGRKGNDTLKGYAGNDTLLGGNDEDTLIGGNGDDILRGGDDNDFLRGGNGADTLDGGQGIDWVSYTEYKKADIDTVIDLRLGQGLEGVALGDSYLSIENVNGSDGNDTVIGTDGANTLNGRKGSDTLKGYAGNDTLLGGSGDDTLVGGAGDDILTGGSGADTFEFFGPTGHDTITDFEYGVDTLLIEGPAVALADLTITDLGVDARIAYEEFSITLMNIDAAAITDDYFNWA
ncbi:M10 family metallopeptidase C-terminal domain-containing protein [Pseudovibrio sp. Alg231-02]|uniref:M10 family metallopeptidase C-terminal domain-containing protein n=1 Tax=Pseudovibrio sp. Alg231-02 TaxID=1922223 RepID=UPI000D55FA44|nr:M10 family metallopeptidase C-terminal domain-containing protein [Pseudovibrio sp. Alg231-02]